METGVQEPSDFHEVRLEKRLQLAILYRSDPNNEKPGGHQSVFVATHVILRDVEKSLAASVPRCRRTCCLSGIDT